MSEVQPVDVNVVPTNLGEAIMIIGVLKTKLANVEKDAELSEFLLFIREYVAKMERNYCLNMPVKEKYVNEVEKRAAIFPSEIDEDIHFRKWLWMLIAGDENQCHSIGHLKIALKKDTKQYIWFARQMKVLYSVLSDDVHSKSALDIRHMKHEKFPEYIKFFNGDLRDAIRNLVQAFDKSEGVDK